jgi:hypothetical protein
MTTPQDNGGPAFSAGYHPEGNSADHPGMTLRDYFAAAALQGLMNQATNYRSMAIEEAEYCYSIADAMLAARKEGA